MRLISPYRRSLAWRRAIAAAALAAYLLATFGVPVPRRFVKFDGVPFPCQDHACGCHTAAQCWEHCCCYSPSQKLAWCHQHGIEPPAQLRAEIAAEPPAPVDGVATHAKSCCAGHEHQVAIVHRDSHDEHGDGACSDCAASKNADDGVGGFVMVMGPLVRQCRAMVDLWCHSGAVSPPPAAIGWTFEWIVVGSVAPFAVLPNSDHLAPPLPPPRLVTV
jgi:hypothetical protein